MDHPVSKPVQGSVDQADEINIYEVWLRLRADWKLIVLTTMIAGGIALAVAFWMTPVYEAMVLLGVTTPDDQGVKGQGLSAIASQFGVASSIMDFGGFSNQKAEAVATLQSRVLTETYIREQNLLPILFAEKWDVTTGKWKTKDPEKQPTLWDGNKRFNKKIRTVIEDKKTGLVYLTISWKNKEQAARWATDLVVRTNTYLREKALDISSRHIEYLNEELKRTSVLELQAAIFRLLEVEIKKTMIARGNIEYAFKTIDPAVVPQERSSPKRLLISAFGTLGGVFVGVILALGRNRQQLPKSPSGT